MSPFKRPHLAFDPAELSILQTAYEETCQELGLVPDGTDDGHSDEKRHALAMALMEAAKSGERNPKILKTHALLALNASHG
jgi:hypothetical protein